MNAAKRRPLAAAWTAFAIAALATTGLAAAHEGHKHETISAGKLARHAKDFYGRTVTVKAEVEKIIDAHSFTLDEDALFAGPDVLVLLPAGVARSLRHDDKVMVTGTVRPFTVVELERDFEFFKGDDIIKADVDVDYKTRPVLVASALLMADGRDLLKGAPAARTAPAGERKVKPSAISASKLVKDPKEYYGRTVTVRAEVEKVLSDHSFTLDEDALFKGPDVLVLLPVGVARTLRHDDVVTVTGQVRPYVTAELERDYDFFDEGKIIDRDTKIDYKTRPVIVATALLAADGRDLLAGAPVAGSPALPSATVAVGVLARNPADLFGRTVTVRAPVGDLFDGRLFTLEEDAVLAGPDLLVIVPTGTSALRRNDVVLVTGTVRPFTVADLRRDFPWFDETRLVIGGQRLDMLGRPVIVADSVKTVGGVELVTR